MLYNRVEQDAVVSATQFNSVNQFDLTDGAITGRRRIPDAAAAFEDVLYFAESTDGQWEAGRGNWEGTPALFKRLEILDSSNAGSAVAWAASAAVRVFLQAPAQRLGLVKALHELTPVTNGPGSFDDEASGYGVGSLWAETSDAYGSPAMHLCIDPTADAAVWVRACLPRYVGWTPDGQLVQQDGTGNISGNHSGYSRNGFSGKLGPDAQGDAGVWSANTTDATPGYLGFDSTSRTNGPLGALTAYGFDGAAAVEAVVTATNGTDHKSWRVTGMVKSATGVVSLVGTPTATEIAATAGAASWSVALNANGIQVTGAAATSITWAATYTLAQALYFGL